MFTLTRTLESVLFTDTLIKKLRIYSANNEIVSESRDVDVVQSMINLMDSRLPDKEFVYLAPLREVNSHISGDALRKCHAIIIPDMPLCENKGEIHLLFTITLFLHVHTE